jgi:hypothetical protein
MQTSDLERGDELIQSDINMTSDTQAVSQRALTHREWDSGTGAVHHRSSAELTGKLCRRVMALICWKVGADGTVTDHMVWVLEEWLHRHRISIYTDLV